MHADAAIGQKTHSLFLNTEMNMLSNLVFAALRIYLFEIIQLEGGYYATTPISKTCDLAHTARLYS